MKLSRRTWLQMLMAVPVIQRVAVASTGWTRPSTPPVTMSGSASPSVSASVSPSCSMSMSFSPSEEWDEDTEY